MSFSGHLACSLSSISLWMLGSDLWTGVCKFLTAKDFLMSSTAACGDGPTCTAITSCVPSRPASTPSTSRRMKSALTPTTTSGWRRQVWKLTTELPKTFWQYMLLNEHSFTLSIERSFNHLNVRSCSSSSCPRAKTHRDPDWAAASGWLHQLHTWKHQLPNRDRAS